MAGEENAVTVRGAYKRYSPSAVVLRGLNMTVLKGSIYGLLGPSGCGKTTLLRSIVGMVWLDAGEIYVKAKKKNNVGYMPQELGLYGDMTVMEAFRFYGELYSMERSKVVSRGKELADFLELPGTSHFIGSLSGGQQRRLSLAITLIHDPDLIILDEPTVGVDPVLSAAIWERLVELTATHCKTVIITTHYIEEARQAHMIGLMRDGVLLAEEPPMDIMASQHCDTLEDAFLNLCQKQEISRDFEEERDLGYPSTQKKIMPTLVDSCPYWKTSRFIAQLNRNFRSVWASLRAMLFFMFFPPVVAVFCYLVLSYNPGTYRALAIVSPELTEGLTTCTTLDYKGCNDYDRPFTCRFIDHIQASTNIPVVYDSFEEAKAAVLRNEVWGVLTMSANYTTAALARVQYDTLSIPDDVIESSFITANMDMSNMWVSTFLKTELIEDLRDMIRGFLEDCGTNPRLLEVPFQYQEPVFGTYKPTFLEFFVPGVTCTFAFCLAIMYTTGAIMYEKGIGLERILVAGMTRLELVAAHTVVQLVIALVQELTVLIVFYYFYAMPVRGNFFLLTLLLIMLQVMGLFYGLLLGLFFDSERDATNAGTGTVNALFMLAGIIWPVEGMHTILRSVLWAIPVQPAVETYRALVMRDWTFTHPVVLQGFMSTTIWTAIFIVLSIIIVRNKNNF